MQNTTIHPMFVVANPMLHAGIVGNFQDYRGLIELGKDNILDRVEKEISLRYKRLLKGAAAAGVEVQIDPSEIEKKVRGSFHWQQFLSKGILKKHAQNFIDASAKSNLPSMKYEIARITDRRDPLNFSNIARISSH